VIGSQAILGEHPHAPRELLRSMDADVYPLHFPERADLIDGSSGEGSPFHSTFGYYAQGVEPETETLEAGWRARLIPIRGPGTRGAVGWCLETHDLVLSKLIAGREKNLEFAAMAARAGLVNAGELSRRLARIDPDERLRSAVRNRIASCVDRNLPF
jgi:hypothetical protein